MCCGLWTRLMYRRCKLNAALTVKRGKKTEEKNGINTEGTEVRAQSSRRDLVKVRTRIGWTDFVIPLVCARAWELGRVAFDEEDIYGGGHCDGLGECLLWAKRGDQGGIVRAAGAVGAARGEDQAGAAGCGWQFHSVEPGHPVDRQRLGTLQEAARVLPRGDRGAAQHGFGYQDRSLAASWRLEWKISRARQRGLCRRDRLPCDGRGSTRGLRDGGHGYGSCRGRDGRAMGIGTS